MCSHTPSGLTRVRIRRGLGDKIRRTWKHFEPRILGYSGEEWATLHELLRSKDKWKGTGLGDMRKRIQHPSKGKAAILPERAHIADVIVGAVDLSNRLWEWIAHSDGYVPDKQINREE